MYLCGPHGAHGGLSPWAPSPFVDHGRDSVRYKCSEQYVMATKALVNDNPRLRAKILANGDDPKLCRALGREIAPFDEEEWARVREDVVLRANFLKFSQNEALRHMLLGTGDLILVEASPWDRIWGIGISVDEALAGKPWKGTNLLGIALMKTRKMLAEGGVPGTPSKTAPPQPRRKKRKPAVADPAHLAYVVEVLANDAAHKPTPCDWELHNNDSCFRHKKTKRVVECAGQDGGALLDAKELIVRATQPGKLEAVEAKRRKQHAERSRSHLLLPPMRLPRPDGGGGPKGLAGGYIARGGRGELY